MSPYSIKEPVILTPITPSSGIDNISKKTGMAKKDWINGLKSPGDVMFWDCNEKYTKRKPKYLGFILRCSKTDFENNKDKTGDFYNKYYYNPEVRIHKIISFGGQRVSGWCEEVVSNGKGVNHTKNITLTIEKKYLTYSWKKWKENHGYACKDGSSGTYIIGEKRKKNDNYFDLNDKFDIENPQIYKTESEIQKSTIEKLKLEIEIQKSIIEIQTKIIEIQQLEI